MTSFVSGAEFGRKAALRIGIFLALTLGFPYIVYGLVAASGARSIGGASGALAVVASTFLKPLIVGAFILLMISPCWRRMRSLGMPAYWGLMVPFLFLMDGAFLWFAGAHWAIFPLGFMPPKPPFYAITALVLVVAMCLATPPSHDEPPGLARFGATGTLTAVLAICVIAIAVAVAAMSLWTFGVIWKMPKQIPPYMWTVIKATGPLEMLKPYACISLSAAFVWLAIVSRRHGHGDTPASPIVGNSTSPQTAVPQQTAFGRR